MKPWLLQFGCVFLALLGGPVAYFLLLRNPWVRNTAWPNLLLLAIALAWGFIQLRQGRTAWTIIALALTLLISIGFVYIRFGLSALPPTQVKAQVGLKAPDFTLTDTQGGQFSLSSLRGRYKIILVFFRGVW